jgi:hypothetical protein
MIASCLKWGNAEEFLRCWRFDGSLAPVPTATRTPEGNLALPASRSLG